MNSRMEKYSDDENIKYKRTSRNANLYKEVYGSYANLENLPIANNTNEIDMKDLKDLVTEAKRDTIRNIDLNQEELTNIRKLEEEREYDINKILEKAKSGISHQKEEQRKKESPNMKYLTTLQTNELKVSAVKKAYEEEKQKKLSKEEPQEDEAIYMTRELKFHDKQLEVTKEIEIIKEKEQAENDALELFKDLKPDENSFIAEPIKVEKENIFSTDHDNEEEKNIDKDIPKLKNIEAELEKTKQNKKRIEDYDDFYTNSYKFSKKDFESDDEDDEDWEEETKSSNVLKIILLIAAILALATAIYYFINRFGTGI